MHKGSITAKKGYQEIMSNLKVKKVYAYCSFSWILNLLSM
jgi:hypothetical protein